MPSKFTLALTYAYWSSFLLILRELIFISAIFMWSCQAVGAEDFFLKPLKVQDMQSLKSYAKPTGSSPITGTKRKVTLDLIAEADSSGRRPRLAGVAVAWTTSHFKGISYQAESCIVDKVLLNSSSLVSEF